MRPAEDLDQCQVCGRPPWYVWTVASLYGESDTVEGQGRGWMVRVERATTIMIGTCGERTCIERARRFISNFRLV